MVVKKMRTARVSSEEFYHLEGDFPQVAEGEECE